MKRTDHARPAPVDVRGALVAADRWIDDTYGELMPYRSRRIAALEAGEPVVVSVWEVAEYLPVPLHVFARQIGLRIRVEADSTLTPVRDVLEDRPYLTENGATGIRRVIVGSEAVGPSIRPRPAPPDYLPYPTRALDGEDAVT